MEERQRRLFEEGRYKIVFSDIDGTLLNNHHHIGDRTREKILELDEKGIPFILVSARMPDGVEIIRRELGNRRPVICYSGGLILDEDGKVLYSRQIELGLAAEIWTALEKECPEICCNTYGENIWAVKDDTNPWVTREEKITQGKSIVGDIRQIFAPAGGIHKFLLMGEVGDIAKAEKFLRDEYPQLSVLRSNFYYLEVMDGKVDKKTGVRYLCDYYGVSMDEAVAFGDGENDLGMIQAAGCGVAMGNAQDYVRRQADYVTGSNEEEGIWQVLRYMNSFTI